MKKNKQIRVVTFNAHFGRNPEKIISAFKQNKNLAKADVIFLQEIEDHVKELSPRAEQIATELGMNHYYAPSRRAWRKGTHGIATLSRFPLLQNTIVHLPVYNMLVRTHQRIALLSEIKIHQTQITFCNVHLDARLNTNSRIEQLDFLIQNLKKNNGKVILGGDLNTIPFRMSAKIVPLFLQDQKGKIHEHLVSEGYRHFWQRDGYTMKQGPLRMQLDHIYSNQFSIVKSGAERRLRISDHVPVWADIKILE